MSDKCPKCGSTAVTRIGEAVWGDIVDCKCTTCHYVLTVGEIVDDLRYKLAAKDAEIERLKAEIAHYQRWVIPQETRIYEMLNLPNVETKVEIIEEDGVE